MADIVISIVAKVAEYLVKPVIREGKYLLCGNEVIKDLENENELLTFELDSLEDRVKRTEARAEKIVKPVEKWLNDVKNVLEEAEDLVEQRMRANTNCFPTWRRYRLCKQMGEKIKAMREFKGKSNIEPFSYPLPLPGIQYQSSENFIYFKSTKVVYDQLLEALRNDSIYMIGVYGMGGCGKTTLVTEVGKSAERLNLFDKVISITVSQPPNIRYIQGKIAEMLGLKLEEQYEEERAQRLWLSLRNMKRVLIIVDDLWGEFDLRKIGICLDNDYKGRWKVIVATRRKVVCDLMDCQKKIHLDILSTDESWTLFQKHANIDNNIFYMSSNDVPQELCKECNGLPIAIVSIASSLKGKSKAEWDMALHSLRHSEAIDDHVEEGMRKAISCLKLSYDYLGNKEAEFLFLMCSMFPEDYLISVEDLFRYAVGLGLGGRFSLESARRRIVAGINKLLDSCLLMHVEERENYVKMHDIVRDVALWIAKTSEDHKILINLDKPFIASVEENSMSDYFAISSWYEDDQYSIELDSPNLEILLLNTSSDNSFNLSHANFEGIEGLKIFHVNNKFFSPLLSLPQSISCLTNLKTLRLTNWHLGDISFIASLLRLEVLDLKGCSFNELPNEMGKLKRLKLLDLSGCRGFQKNYNGAIGRCSQLEEFYASEISPFCHISAIIEDIGTLKLHRFVIYGDSSMFLPGASLGVGKRGVLELNHVNIYKVKAVEKNLLQIANAVALSSLHGGCGNVIPDLVEAVGGMNYLIDLRLDSCAEIYCILDATSHLEVDALLPGLVELWLSGLVNLRDLCRGPPLLMRRFFETLEKIYITNCDQLHNLFPRECKLPNLKFLILQSGKLKVLFSLSVAQSLQQLENLTLRDCTELKHIIACEREHSSHTSQEIAPTLDNSHSIMPNLKKVYIANCCKLECIFPICCVGGLARLQSIEIRWAPKLKYVFGECDHEDNASSLQYENQIMFPHLEILLRGDLENLAGICPEKYHAKWPSLGNLDVRDLCLIKLRTLFEIQNFV